MRIHVFTTREISDEDFCSWISDLKKLGSPINGVELLKKGKFTCKTDLGYTKAKTTFRIVKR